jgi:hypothetical protein
MNVVKFPCPDDRPAAGWPAAELRGVINACSESIASGAASGWEVGKTENGDPQIYLLGPPPDYDCILCISRLGPLYVIEDGNGRVLFEHSDPLLLAEQTTQLLRRGKAAITARIAVAWCALREAIEEKTEVILAEPLELLTHLAPQMAALA